MRLTDLPVLALAPLLVLVLLLPTLADPLPAIFHPPAPTLSRALSAQASQRLLAHHASSDSGKGQGRNKTPEGWEDLELLDTVLVSTVDGGLHALERSTGRRIWSRLIVGNGIVQSDLTNETWREPGGLLEDRAGEQTQEHHGVPQTAVDPAYIVDPYDGQLYVQVEVPDGGKTVQKLPLTMEQLIDLSPFTFPQEHSHVFIGSRSTSLLALDLQTGKAISSFGKASRGDVDADCLKRFENGLKARGVGTIGADLEAEKRRRCAKSIEERPEDRLLIGRTDYHLSIHAGMRGAVQDLSFTKLVPNSIHKDLAEYWRKNGNVKGEVYVSERSRGREAAANPAPIEVRSTGQSGQAGPDGPRADGPRMKTEAEMENRWRIEVLHDGTIVGIEQGHGVRWHNFLPSVAVSVYDILLPTIPGAQPILLPQPPAYVATLFPQEHLNVQLLSMPTSAYITALPAVLRAAGEIEEPSDELEDATEPPPVPEGDLARNLTAVNVFALSSDHCPLLVLAPQHKPDELIGSHVVQAAVKERIPYLLDQGSDRGVVNHSVTEDNVTEPETLPPAEEPARFRLLWAIGAWMWNRWWFWSLMIIIGLSVLLIAFDRRLRMLSDQQQPSRLERQSIEGRVSAEHAHANGYIPVSNGDIASEPKIQPTDPEKGGEIEQVEEVAPPIISGKKPNGRRRKRGKRKANKDGNDKDASDDEEDDEGSGENAADQAGPSEANDAVTIPVRTAKKEGASMEGLTISEDVLGFGSHGTVVYKGVFQGRAVAVKRLLQDFVTVASQEVSLLQASDDHQNVVRYFCQERRGNFLYIALELCPASLAEVVEQPDQHQELAVAFEPKKALYQVTAGLRHLHGLKIIHRDIKPQNVLISVKKNGSLRMMLSDFGLAKRLDHGQSSYVQTGKHAIGSVGWRAPECLRGDVQLDDFSDGSTPQHSSRTGEDIAAKKTAGSRLTKAVDLFALGCLYFYALTAGQHPYGDRYEREMNIIRNDKVAMSKLDTLGEDGHEAAEILNRLLSPSAEERPDTSTCLVHPLFWSASKRLSFLCDASDRFEIMELQPPEPTLVQLETGASSVVGQNWQKRLDTLFLENLGKHRKYDGRSVRDLLRALRNKKNHYQDLPVNVQRRLGALPAGFLTYFTSRFPALFTHVHHIVRESKLRHEAMFAPYFEVEE